MTSYGSPFAMRASACRASVTTSTSSSSDERARDGVADEALVVDDEHPPPRRARGRRARSRARAPRQVFAGGRTTRKVVPWPGALDRP